eukprot:m.60696 g.60696  ORF g.60696 m.60696 type:complete len:551 (+) comp11344_c0_seq2:106-1758(+)
MHRARGRVETPNVASISKPILSANKQTDSEDNAFKRKLQFDDDKDGSKGKRKRRGSANSAVGGKRTSSRLGAPLTERQQLRLAMKDSEREAMRQNMHKRNASGETPLHQVVIKGNLEYVKFLLDHKAPVNTKDYAGWSPLHEACNHGFLEITNLLLEHKADVNATGGDGDTPLHDAAINSHLEVAKALLRAGANAKALNKKKLSPLDVACDPSMIEVLTEAGAPAKGLKKSTLLNSYVTSPTRKPVKPRTPSVTSSNDTSESNNSSADETMKTEPKTVSNKKSRRRETTPIAKETPPRRNSKPTSLEFETDTESEITPKKNTTPIVKPDSAKSTDSSGKRDSLRKLKRDKPISFKITRGNPSLNFDHMAPVQQLIPETPPEYSKFLLSTGDYHECRINELAAKAKDSVPKSVPNKCKNLYVKQEQERWKLNRRMAREIDRAQLVYERDILRVYDEASRCVGNTLDPAGPKERESLLFLIGSSGLVVDLVGSIEAVNIKHSDIVYEIQQRHACEAEVLLEMQNMAWEHHFPDTPSYCRKVVSPDFSFYTKC